MKKSTKRLLSMIMALAMILSLLPVMAFAAAPTTLYLKPSSNWMEAGARFAAYFFGNGEKWVSMTDSDGDGYYEVAVPSGFSKVIFCRMNSGASANNWNNKWNQTGDLTIPTNGNNCFTILAGSWDGATTGWGKYTPIVVPEWNSPIVEGDSVTFNYWSSDTLTSVDVRGTINNWTETAEHHMTKDAETGIWSVTVSNLYNGTYEYKFVTNGTNWINDPKNTGTQIGGNNTFTITDGVVDSNEPEYTSPVISGTTVTFNYWQAEEFTSATVFGDMSDDGWATAYPMVKNEETGVWSVTVEVPYNGTYEYKIVVDEAWLKDPKNDNVADNGNSYFAITDGEDKPAVPKNVTLHVQANQAWEKAYAYYWVGQTSLVTWPGKEMTIEEGYAGWYSITLSDYTEDAINVIFTNNSGIQTNDLAIAALPEGNSEYWYVPGADAWGKGTLTNEAPAAYVQQETATCQVTVHFQNKLGWETVNGYAWTNIWPAQYPAEPWPGTALTEEDGWYTVSFNATYPVGDDVFVIFNDGNGQQTDNLRITIDAEESVERWVVPIGQQTEYLSEMCEVLNGKPASPVAEIYNKGCFLTFEDAYAAADPDAGDSIVLLSDITVNDLVVDKEMYLDLNGCNATINAASATHNIYAQDSATVNDQATRWGTLITNGVECLALGGYLMLPETEGYSFHCYDIYISHVSLKPNSDALGFKAKVVADSAVMAAITEFGFEMRVADGEIVTVTKEAGEDFDGVFTLRLQGIMAGNGSEMEITATPFVIMNEEQMYGSSETTTMKQTIRQIDNTWENYSAEEQTAVRTYANDYYSVMQHWDLKNIFVTIDIPIEAAA